MQQEDGVILVALPATLVQIWANTSQVGIEHDQPAADGTVLNISVEKDLGGLHPRPEEH